MRLVSISAANASPTNKAMMNATTRLVRARIARLAGTIGLTTSANSATATTPPNEATTILCILPTWPTRSAILRSRIRPAAMPKRPRHRSRSLNTYTVSRSSRSGRTPGSPGTSGRSAPGPLSS
jgi:hypothetical protein